MIGKRLIEIARKAIKTYFSKEDFNVDEFNEKKGIFVTLYKKNELRGCIGYIKEIELNKGIVEAARSAAGCIGYIKEIELNKGIVEAARSAAFSDPRFNPLQEDELKDIRIEISLLTKPELLEGNYLKQIKIGRDGLIIESNFTSGLLLPQVFVEYNADIEEALEMTCEKAGLNRDAWKEKDIRVYKFRCEVYSEEKPNGNVKKLM